MPDLRSVAASTADWILQARNAARLGNSQLRTGVVRQAASVFRALAGNPQVRSLHW
jgi:hypothetical protein